MISEQKTTVQKGDSTERSMVVSFVKSEVQLGPELGHFQVHDETIWTIKVSVTTTIVG